MLLRALLAAMTWLVGCQSAASSHAHHEAHGHGAHEHHTGNHRFDDAAKWSKEFDDPARDAWQKPDEVVALAALEAGMTVVDLGAGTGYFVKRLSQAVGPSGKVLALDIEPDMVRFMKERAAREGLANVEARQCPTDSTGLAEGSVDRVLVVDTWHHLEQRAAYTKHLASVLKPGGSVVVVDFTKESPKGPPAKYKLSADEVLAELRAAGLTARISEETLPDQYVIVGTRGAP